MKIFIPFWILCVVLFFMSSCASDRAQVASDTRAGVRAVISAQESGSSTDQLTILRGVDARLPAVAEVNSAEWPAPQMTSEQIQKNPQAYASSAPPEPARAWLIAGLGAAAIAGLGLLRALAPMIPGGGPLIKGVADMAWNIMATKNQRAADAAQAGIVLAARTLAPLAADLRTMNSTLLPDYVAKHLDDPRITAALQTLAEPPTNSLPITDQGIAVPKWSLPPMPRGGTGKA